MKPVDGTAETPADVGLKEESRLTGISLSTLRRRRGLRVLDRVGPAEPAQPTPTEMLTGTPSWDQVASLQDQLTQAQQRAAVPEAIAHERGSALEDAPRAMRMLETRTLTPVSTPVEPSNIKANLKLVPAEPAPEQPLEPRVGRPLRSWWRNRQR